MNLGFFFAPVNNLDRKCAETWHPGPHWVVLKGDEDFSFAGEGRN